jgi:hypothetical protein
MIQIPPPTLLLPKLPPLTRETLLQGLKVGQVLQAQVLSENRDGQLKLLIGASKLIARTPLQASAGQRLTLQVEKTEPLPTLKLLAPAEQQQVLTEAMKRVLPRQRPLVDLFQHLIQLRQAPTAQLPAPIKQAVAALTERLLSVEQPGFKPNLKAALLDSGLFAESRLIRQGSPRSDLKLDLFKLYELIKSLSPQPIAVDQTKGQGQARAPGPEPDPTNQQAQTPFKQLAELGRQLEGAIARIQAHQLASLPQDDPTRQVWQFELPLRHQEQLDMFQFSISREGASARDEATVQWHLTLQMNLRPLGPMRVHLQLQGKALATVFWAERQGTMQLLERHLPELQQAFEQADLEVTKLQAYRAKLATEDPLPRHQGLLNEKA